MIEYVSVYILQYISMYTFEGQTCFHKYKRAPYYD